MTGTYRKRRILPKRPVARKRRVLPKRGKLVAYKAKNQAAYKATNMLRVKTLIPKNIFVSLQYKTTIRFSAMGESANGKLCPNIIDICMNNPIRPGGTGQNLFQGIVSVPLVVGTTPIYSTSNPEVNLATKIAPFFLEYSRAVVLNSKAKVVWTQIPNQLGFGQTFSNQPIPSGETESALAITEPTLDGTVYVSQCRSTTADNTVELPLHNATNLFDLKNRTPGISMRRIFCNKYSTRGITQLATYNPKVAFNYKDIKDNIEALQFSTATGNPLRGSYNSCAVHKYIPVGLSHPKQIPLFEAEVMVNYNIEFFRRNNHIGSNNPQPRMAPHTSEL